MMWLCNVCHKIKVCDLCNKYSYTFGRYLYVKGCNNTPLKKKLILKKRSNYYFEKKKKLLF